MTHDEFMHRVLDTMAGDNAEFRRDLQRVYDAGKESVWRVDAQPMPNPPTPIPSGRCERCGKPIDDHLTDGRCP